MDMLSFQMHEKESTPGANNFLSLRITLISLHNPLAAIALTGKRTDKQWWPLISRLGQKKACTENHAALPISVLLSYLLQTCFSQCSQHYPVFRNGI
jgi:hypothetical protein